MSVNFLYNTLRLLLLLLLLTNLTTNQQFAEKIADIGDRFDVDENLQAETDALLSLFDQMPSVRIKIKEEPILSSGTNTERGVAYTNCENHGFPTIFVKKIFYQKANRKQLTNILKHELTHAWLCRQQLMAGHDERFREKFTQVGGFGN